MSGSSVSSTRSATLVSASRSSRSRIWRLVTYLPSRPANGELFTSNVMLIVGSSTTSGGSASGCAGSQSVSEIVGILDAGERDDVAGARLVDLDAIEAEEAEHLHDCARCAPCPSRSTTATGMLRRSVPRLMRPMPIAPT